MSKSKYIFNPELKKYEKINPIVMPFLLPFMQKLMTTLYNKETSDDEMTVEHRKVEAKDGTMLRALLYTPKDVIENGPCLIFIHGGGFAYQAAPYHFVLARRFAKALNVKTVFVDYRLAPKHTFPTAPEDVFSVYKWVVDNADNLQIDKNKIAVCGDSAGGNLSTVLCLMARDRGVQIPCAQMLIYPFTNRSMQSQSMKEFTDTPMCNSTVGKKFNQIYMPFETHENIEYFSPIEAKSLEKLPPAYIETAEYDCLRDDGIAYAHALQDTGIEVELYETKATMHGYDIAIDSNLIKDCMKKRISFLKKYLLS